MRLGDFDNDGNLDVVTPDSAWPALLPTYLLPKLPQRPEGARLKRVILNQIANDIPMVNGRPGDLNEDGFLDMALIPMPARAEILISYNDGAGHFAPAFSLPVGVRPTDVAIVDLNHDAHLDLLVTDGSTSTLSVLLGQGKGAFASPLSSEAFASSRTLRVQDINHDGFKDVALLQEHQIAILLGNGQGQFTYSHALPTCESPGWMEVADLNEDGQLDAVVSCPRGAALGVSLSIDDAAPGQSRQLPIPGLPYGLAIADFDADGHLDIAVGHLSGGFIHWLRNNWKNPGEFSPPKAAAAGFLEWATSPAQLEAGDLNQDGFPDLVTANRNWGGFGILLSHPTEEPTSP